MKKSIVIITGLALLILAIIFDKQIANNIVNYRTTFLTLAMLMFSTIGAAIVVFLVVTLLFIKDRKKREYLPLLWLTIIGSLLAGLALKYLIARPRPMVLPLEIKNSFSFPSTHAVAVFAPLALIDKEFPKLKWVWLAIALLVLLSRVYLGVHYLSDVIAGALIGYMAGLLLLLLTKNI